jgi:hypothetical protein
MKKLLLIVALLLIACGHRYGKRQGYSEFRVGEVEYKYNAVEGTLFITTTHSGHIFFYVPAAPIFTEFPAEESVGVWYTIMGTGMNERLSIDSVKVIKEKSK